MTEIRNIDKLLSKLNRIGGNYKGILVKSLDKNIKMVQAQAKILCPVDYGDLRNSIKAEVQEENTGIVAKVYTNSDHAAYVEFGTGIVGENTNKQEGISFKQEKWFAIIPDVGPRWIEGQPAQPFLYPSLKDNEESVIKNIKADIRQEIRRISNT